MKVRATNQYKELNVADKDLNRIPEEGEIFEISSERFAILNGDNAFKAIFVKSVEETTEEEKVIEQAVAKRPAKRKKA